jgi:pimeloyl-ACP methyl ester carboxylesterase
MSGGSSGSTSRSDSEAEAEVRTDPSAAGLGERAAEAGQDFSARLATLVGRVTLRLGGHPLRHWLGTFHRADSRREGGHAFYVTTDDGIRLHAWYFPAVPPSRADAASQARLPIVMLHGWLEIKEFHFNRARQLSRRGHDVILFDHRGHGRSDAAPASFGVRERCDLTEVIDEAQKRGLVGERVITMGFSMGAATCLQQAASDRRVAAVVAFAPFVDLRQAIKSFRDRLARRVPDQWLLPGFERATEEAGYRLDDVSTLEAIEHLSQPVLLIEGDRDHNLPPATHVEPLAAAKRQGRLERFVVEGATHLTLCRQLWPGLDETVERFCAEVSDGSSH